LVEDKRRIQVVASPTGVGKSLVVATYIAFVQKRGVVLTATKGLQDQYTADFREIGMVDVRGMSNYECLSEGGRCDEGSCLDGGACHLKDMGCLYFDAVRTAEKAEIVVTNYAFWFTRRKTFRGLGKVDVLVCDECLLPSADVGGRRLIDIRVGDFVPSFDPVTHELMPKRVLARTVSKPTRLLRLHYGGRDIVCTPTHPILTPLGWIAAGSLRIGDLVLCSPYAISTDRNGMPPMQAGYHAGYRESLAVAQLPETGATGILLKALWQALQRYSSSGPFSDDSGPKAETFAADEAKESDAFGRCKSQDANDAAGDGVEAASAGGQREADPVAGYVAGFAVGLADRILGKPEATASWLSEQLQIGHSGADAKGGDRGRWPWASGLDSAGTGREEDACLVPARLDGIEVHEPGSGGTFGGLCPDGLVYNLEIEGSRAYVAEGLAVHNSHQIDGELGGFLHVEFRHDEVVFPPDADDLDVEGWRAWAAIVGPSVKQRGGHAPKWARRKLRETVAKLEAIENMHGRWVIERTPTGGWSFDPLWVGPYVEGWLFGGVPKIILASATINRETIKRLGIKEGEYNFIEPRSPIPVSRRPVVHVETGVRMNWRTPDDEWQKIVDAMDAAIEARLDRKGLIHAVSYARTKDIIARSAYRDIMVVHDSRNTKEVVEEFKRAEPPLILVSPSITTGWDFPFDAAHYQLIPKVPFPDMRSALMAARMKEDRGYLAHVTLQILVQMCGRVARDPKDLGETLVFDAMCQWLVNRNRRQIPRFFLQAWRWSSRLPAPPPLPSVTPKIYVEKA
jgi:hypothetical protein